MTLPLRRLTGAVMLSAAKHLQCRPAQTPFRFFASLRMTDQDDRFAQMTGEKAVTVMPSEAKGPQIPRKVGGAASQIRALLTLSEPRP